MLRWNKYLLSSHKHRTNKLSYHLNLKNIRYGWILIQSNATQTQDIQEFSKTVSGSYGALFVKKESKSRVPGLLCYQKKVIRALNSKFPAQLSNI